MSEELQSQQVECTLEHFFSDGIYVRQITMPGGAFVKGKVHKTKHLNVVIRGKVLMLDSDGTINVIHATKHPVTFESEAGVSKLLYIHEETVWQTIHTNEENEEDVTLLEDQLVESYDELDEALMLEEMETFRKLIEGEEVAA